MGLTWHLVVRGLIAKLESNLFVWCFLHDGPAFSENIYQRGSNWTLADEKGPIILKILVPCTQHIAVKGREEMQQNASTNVARLWSNKDPLSKFEVIFASINDPYFIRPSALTNVPCAEIADSIHHQPFLWIKIFRKSPICIPSFQGKIARGRGRHFGQNLATRKGSIRGKIPHLRQIAQT